MDRVRVTITWWTPPGSGEATVALERFGQNGQRLTCLVDMTTDAVPLLRLLALQLEAEDNPTLFP